MADAPTRSADLLPTKLYVAELLMLPLFWLAPAMVLVGGGTIRMDVHELEAEYGVEFDDTRYLWYFAPFVLSYFGSLGYKQTRVRKVAEHHGLSTVELAHLVDRLDAPKGYVVRGLAAVQLLCFLLFLVTPADFPTLLLAVLGLFVVTLPVSPPAVWLDQRSVREVPEVGWEWPRYLHVLASLIPFGVVAYQVQRNQHLQYAVLVRVWDVDVDDFSVPEEELSTMQRLAKRLGA